MAMQRLLPVANGGLPEVHWGADQQAAVDCTFAAIPEIQNSKLIIGLLSGSRSTDLQIAYPKAAVGKQALTASSWRRLQTFGEKVRPFALTAVSQ
jgi:hypothetical protein